MFSLSRHFNRRQEELSQKFLLGADNVCTPSLRRSAAGP
jgi:hypothetical protein